MATNARDNQGTGFVNYNDILNANQGAGERMGQAVGQGLESQAGAVNSNLASQQDQFKQGVGSANQDWSNVSSLARQLAGAPPTAGTTTTTGTTPDYSNIAGTVQGTGTGGALSTGDIANVQKNSGTFSGYQYGGPQDLQDVSGLQSQAYGASTAGRLAGTGQGQQQLLSQYVGGGANYTPGLSSFDQSLLGQKGQAAINQGRQQLGNVASNVNQGINSAQAQAQSLANTITGEKTDLGKAITNNYAGLTSLGTTQKANEDANIANIVELLKGTNPNATASDPNAINTDFSKLSPAAQAELANLNPDLAKYGVDLGATIYNNKDSSFNNAGGGAAANTVLQQIASRLAQNNPTGGKVYDPTQMKAAQLLAAFGQQGQSSADIDPTTGKLSGVIDPSAIFGGKDTGATATQNLLSSNTQASQSDKAYLQALADQSKGFNQMGQTFAGVYGGAYKAPENAPGTNPWMAAAGIAPLTAGVPGGDMALNQGDTKNFQGYGQGLNSWQMAQNAITGSTNQLNDLATLAHNSGLSGYTNFDPITDRANAIRGDILYGKNPSYGGESQEMANAIHSLMADTVTGQADYDKSNISLADYLKSLAPQLGDSTKETVDPTKVKARTV